MTDSSSVELGPFKATVHYESTTLLFTLIANKMQRSIKCRRRIVHLLPKNCCIVWQLSVIFCVELLLEMKRGFFNAILKQIERVHNGTLSIRVDWRKLDMSIPRAKLMLVFFLAVGELFAKNLYHQDRVRLFTYWSWSIWGEEFCHIVLAALKHGSFTMMMGRATHHWLWEFSWHKKYSYPSWCILEAWLGTVWILFGFQTTKACLKGHHSWTLENIHSAAMRALNNHQHADFEHCYE